MEQDQRDERDKVIRDLSHTIRNLTASVLEPLNEYSKYDEENRIAVQSAIRGIGFIRETVNALNLSFRGEPEDFIKDAKGAYVCSMLDIVLNSLRSAVECMLDGNNFADFCHNYFPAREKFDNAKNEWGSVLDSYSLLTANEFLKSNMLDFKIEGETALKEMR